MFAGRGGLGVAREPQQQEFCLAAKTNAPAEFVLLDTDSVTSRHLRRDAQQRGSRLNTFNISRDALRSALRTRSAQSFGILYNGLFEGS